MPNKHAAIKDLRKNKRRAERNFRLKTHMKAMLRKAQDLVKEGKLAEAKTAVSAFQAVADKAAKHGVVSRNAVGHKKSTMMRALIAKK
jgi:ribosomal protein S20